MSGDLGILSGVSIGNNLWDKIKNYASQKEDTPKAETEAKLLAQASVDFKEERAWWEVLLFGGASGGGVAGCGYGAEKILNKPRDAGVDGDGGDGDGGPECNNYPGSFNLSSPPDSNSATSLRPSFDWTDSIDPDPGDTISYSLLIDTDSLFPAPTTYTDISTSEFNLPTPLANNTTYYWKVIAKDLCGQETESAETFSFTTVVACSTSPNAFSLTSPTNGSTDVSVTPTFDWEDSIDPDVGDAVTYTLQIDTSDLFPAPTEFTDLSDSTYTMTTSLANGTTYYWRVIAKDGCDNEVTSTEVFSFTTEFTCTPITPALIYIDFSNAEGFTLPDASYAPGGIVQSGVILSRPGMECYHAADGVLPDAAIPAWTPDPNPHPIGATDLGIDPLTLENAVEEDSTSFDGVLNWIRDTIGFDNGRIWCVQGRLRVLSSSGTGQGSALEIFDGTKVVQLGFLTDRVQDADNTSFSYPLDMLSRSNTVQFCGTGSSYWLYANEDIYQNTRTLDGPGLLTLPSSENKFLWGDLSPASGYDAHVFYNHICYITNYIGFNASGSITLRYDLGTATNNLGSGARALIDGLFPPLTGIVIENTRSGDTPDPGTGTWSALQPLSMDDIQSPPNRYLEIVVNLSTGNTNVSPLYRGIQFENLCEH